MRTTILAALAASSAALLPAGAQARVYTTERMDTEHRAALGVSTTATGTLRDTLGVMITSITSGGPAEKAGLEEGNRIAAINGVDLRVAREDAGDDYMANARVQRLTRERAVVRRRECDRCAAGKPDDADTELLRDLLEERTCSLARCSEPRRLDVFRTH